MLASCTCEMPKGHQYRAAEGNISLLRPTPPQPPKKYSLLQGLECWIIIMISIVDILTSYKNAEGNAIQ